MAIAASRTQILTGEDHAIAVKREVVIDPESGVAVQVEKAVIAVDLGDGRVAVQERQRLIGVNVPTQQAQPRAIAYRPSSTTSDADNAALICCCCCILTIFFPPWIICWLLYCCLVNENN